MDYDIIVIGGGFFGMYISEFFSSKKSSVLLLEREGSFMRRASYHNQARIHNGYHYPRSMLTAFRSRMSFPRFVNEFRDCVVSDFEKYYLIGTHLGKVSAGQFERFCERIGSPCDRAPNWLQQLVDPNFIEACFSTVEYAFDADKLRDTMVARLAQTSVDCRLGVAADKVQRQADRLVVTLRTPDGSIEEAVGTQVLNCTYSNLNRFLANSDLPIIPLKHEMTEMCAVEVPEVFRKVGLTVMCGPFFSVMPFPPLGLHSFSHVRYTPHYQWFEDTERERTNARFLDAEPRKSAWEHMRRDAARYIPLLRECRYVQSLWEVKTVLPRSETDDSRPILFRLDHGLPGLHCILGGKIDNVYDVVSVIESRGLYANASAR